MKRAVVLLTVALSVILAVGFSAKAFSVAKPPTPIIKAGKKQISTTQGSYCWKGFFSAECVDMASPPELVKNKPAVAVKPGAKITISYEKEPAAGSIGVTQWKDVNNPTAANFQGNVLTVPKEKGVYIYDVFARWDNKGDACHAFVIEVK